jgi:hypothetical protein
MKKFRVIISTKNGKETMADCTRWGNDAFDVLSTVTLEYKVLIDKKTKNEITDLKIKIQEV